MQYEAITDDVQPRRFPFWAVILIAFLVAIIAGLAYRQHKVAVHDRRVAQAQAQVDKYRSALDKIAAESTIDEGDAVRFNDAERDGIRVGEQRHDASTNFMENLPQEITLTQQETTDVSMMSAALNDEVKEQDKIADILAGLYGPSSVVNVRDRIQRFDSLAGQAIDYWQRANQGRSDLLNAYANGRVWLDAADVQRDIGQEYVQATSLMTQATSAYGDIKTQWAILQDKVKSDYMSANTALEKAKKAY